MTTASLSIPQYDRFLIDALANALDQAQNFEILDNLGNHFITWQQWWQLRWYFSFVSTISIQVEIVDKDGDSGGTIWNNESKSD